ncbi:MAG: C-terminal target protein, partial [Phycisphaerales bacterium]|nr:C-terminal target protein [Phycisphaerales bacterium]
VIAVELHQAAVDSSDISFDLTLGATLNGTTPAPTVPAAPTTLTATAGVSSITLVWADNSNNESGFVIERSADGGATFTPLATVAAYTTQYTDNDLPSATRYVYRVRATDATGNSAYSNVAEATTPVTPPATTTLPAPWAGTDIGAIGNAGSSAYASGTFTVKGGGGDIWNSADAFRFIYQPVTGDATIITRVASQTNTNAWAKAGVMIRESLAAGSRNAAVHVTPTNGTVMTYRTATGGASDGWFSTGNAAIWLKLVRTGNTFTSYRSSNGTTWTQIGTESITMAASVYIGLCVAAKSTTTLSTATFSNVTVAAVAQAATATRLAFAPATTSAAMTSDDRVISLLTELV